MDLVDAIVDWMGSVHGRKRVYGWMWFLALVVVPIASAMAARELRARRNRLLRGADQAVAAAPLYAAVRVGEGPTALLVEAALRHEPGRYELQWVERRGEGEARTRCERFASLDQVERYLAQHSPLRLGDFRAAPG